MAETYSEFHLKAVEKVRSLWRKYIVNPDPQGLVAAFGNMPEDMVMIGTGRHELYKNRQDFVQGMSADQLEARRIQFELQDEWYDVQPITEDVCVVYGSIWVREKVTPGKLVLVDMEGSRFTVVCRRAGEGVQVCSIHHSMPYQDQGEDEYYPKTLASLANEAIKKTKALERRVELDHLTELYNRVYMEWHVSRVMQDQSGYFFALDLDNFKRINDTMGHVAGDQVIRAFASLLRSVFDPTALLGRMGGDEFAVWDADIRSREEADLRFCRLQEGCRGLSDRLGAPVSCSAGIALGGRCGEDFIGLYQRADQALYRAKAKGRACALWAES